MYYVYMLQDGQKKLYIGYSSDLRRRLNEHRGRRVYTTKRMKEPKLLYYEAYSNQEAAKEREKNLKKFGSSYHGLIKRLKLN